MKPKDGRFDIRGRINFYFFPQVNFPVCRSPRLTNTVSGDK